MIFIERMIQIKNHNYAEFCRHSGKGDKANGPATDKLYSSSHSNHTPPISAKGNVPIIIRTFDIRLKVNHKRTNIIISVTGKTILSVAVARSRYSNCPDQRETRPAAIPPSPPPVLHFIHGGLQIAPAQVHVDPAGKARVFTFSIGGPSVTTISANSPAPLATAGGHYRQHPQRVDVITQIAGITQVDGIPLASWITSPMLSPPTSVEPGFAVHRRKRRSAPLLPVDTYIHVAPAFQTLRQRRGNAGNVLHHLLNLPGHALNVGNIIAVHLNADRAFDPGCQHVRAVTDRRHLHIGNTRQRHGFIKLLHQLLRRHSGRHCSRGLK